MNFPTSDSVGSFIHRADLTLSKHFKNRLRRFDLSPEHHRFLELLYHGDGSTQVDIAEKLGRDEGSITRTVSRMEEKGLVIRCDSERDRRIRTVFITDEGRRVHEATRSATTEFDDALVHGLTPADIAQFRRTMARVVDNAERAAVD